jgi:putative hemolysin
MNIILEFLIILGLILINSFLAMAEIAVVSARKTHLRVRAAAGDPAYQAALELANSPSRFLSSVQIGITLVGILAGAFGGATIAEALEELFIGLGLTQDISEASSVAIVVVIITYVSLVIGELAPKQIALFNAEQVAAMVARPMTFISRIAAPLVRLLSVSTTLVLRLLGLRTSTEPAITEEEVKMLVDQGTELGVFKPIEDTIVDKVFQLGDQRIESLATPRTEMIWLDLNDPLGLSIEKIKAVDYSHFPVARDNLDNLLGFVKANDLLTQFLEEGTIDLKKNLLKPLYVPENSLVFNALERIRTTGYEIAFVMDEFGGIQGLVTLRDLLEGLVGDIPQIKEIHDPDVVQLGDSTYLLDGMISIQEFREIFGLKELPGEKYNYYQTLAGFVLNLFGHIPTTGETVQWKGYHIEVVDMDGMRIDKVHVIPPTGNS